MADDSPMAEPGHPIRKAAVKQHGGPGSDLLISLFVGLPLAIGAVTLFPPPFGVIAILAELAVIALLLWEGQKTARLKADRESDRAGTSL